MDVEKLAQTLANARETGIQARMPFPDPAPTMEQAYEVQRRANAIYAEDFAGWKCGATNQGALDGLGLNESFIGPIPKRAVRGDGATIPFSETIGAVEPEIAFRLAADLDGDADEAAARDAVASVHLVLEVIGRCVTGSGYEKGVGLTLDFAGNAFFVVGPEVADWRERNMADIAVEVVRDGETVAAGSTANVMGDPFTSLAWAAKRLARDGVKLKAGDWVSTGTCTAAVPASKGSTIRATFAELGSVSVSFA